MCLLTVVEVADLLSVTEWTIRNWVREDRIPCVRIGSTLRFYYDDVMQAICPSVQVEQAKVAIAEGGSGSYAKLRQYRRTINN